MKIAIIGAGVAGLACALECEKLNLVPHVFDRNESVGWPFSTISIHLNVLGHSINKSFLTYFQQRYGLNLKPVNYLKQVVMKSPHKQAVIEGNLGYLFMKGKDVDSIENQLYRKLSNTVVHYNCRADYQELSKEYDYVIIAEGKDETAKKLRVWTQLGQAYIKEAIVCGSFIPGTSQVYFNTEYAGTGFARLTPFSKSKALAALYVIGPQFNDFDKDRLFAGFLESEGLTNLECTYYLSLPPFNIGKVTEFKIGNILLTGQAAGLTERLLGSGNINGMFSGIFAARAVIEGKSYESLIKPLSDHVENISVFRHVINKYSNKDFDKLIGMLGTPGIKQTIYNSGISFTDRAGWILKQIQKNNSGEN